jgi:hypothetical protein
MATAKSRQNIPVITNAAAPEVDADEVSRLFAMFDALSASPTHSRLTLHDRDDEIVLYAFNLWCSSRQLNVIREAREAHGMRWISHTAALADGIELHLIGRHVDVVSGSAVREALREPHWTDPDRFDSREPDWDSERKEPQS